MTSMRRLTDSAIVAWLLGATACSGGAPTSVRFELAQSQAEARWSREALASYRFTIHRSCECLPEMTGPTVVVVTDRIVASRHYQRTGAAVPERYVDLFPTVEGLFALIDLAREQGAVSIDVQYDATYGYPTHIAIDYAAPMVDDEVVYTISSFQTP